MTDTELYRELHATQLERQLDATHYSARRVLDIVTAQRRITSILDVGCGLGGWLSAAAEKGIARRRGLEGHWLERERAREAVHIDTIDLEQSFDLRERFDLVLAIEVAEHLPEQSAEDFVRSLVRHGDLIVFSAAIPCQGGHGHVNEQPLSYWVREFAALGYYLIDAFRGYLWDDAGVLLWVKQNAVAFARDPKALAPARPLVDVVHPHLFETSARQYAAVIEGLVQSGFARVEGGRIYLERPR